MRVLIAGCGYVGSALASQLAASGHTVFGLRRNVAVLPTGVTGVAADLSDPATLTGLPPVDALVYSAAADGRTRESYEAAYLRGLDNVLAAVDARALASEGQKTQWAPTRNFSSLNARAVFAGEEGETAAGGKKLASPGIESKKPSASSPQSNGGSTH